MHVTHRQHTVVSVGLDHASQQHDRRDIQHESGRECRDVPPPIIYRARIHPLAEANVHKNDERAADGQAELDCG